MATRAAIAASWIATAGCLVACGGRSGLLVEERSPDASAPDAGGPTGTSVHGRITAHYTTDVGAIDRGVDLSTITIDAFAELADGTFATVHGVGSADGSFVVASVPDGPFQLRIGSTVLVHPTRELSLSVYVAGRPDAVVLQDGQVLEAQLDVDNLSPWPTGPIPPFQLVSSNAGCNASSTGGAFPNGAPMPGDTALVGAVLGFGGPAAVEIDGRRGDRATLTQSAQETNATGTAFSRVVRALDIPTPELHAVGAAAQVRRTFGDVAPDKEITFSWDTASFLAIASKISPGAKPAHATFNILALPSGPTPALAPPLWLTPVGRSAVAQVVLMQLINANPAAPSVPDRFAFGNPLPGPAWAISSFFFTSSTTVVDPEGGTVDVGFYGGFTRYATVDTLGVGPLAPMITPPADLRVNGVDVFSVHSGIGAPAIVTWTAATSQDPNFGSGTIVYDLSMSPIFADASSLGLSFRTTETRLALPPAVAVAGQAYTVTLSATAVAGRDPSNPAYESVTIQSAPFTL